MFVAAEYYKSSTINNPKHVTKVGETLTGGKAFFSRQYVMCVLTL